MIQRIIPSSGELLPVIGLGTWQTFDVASEQSYPALKNVLTTLHKAGGTVIDSSPMYGRAEKVVGDITVGMDNADFFYATKIWTSGSKEGIRQMEDSFLKMKRKTMDLMQIHNLLDWKTHLPQLRRWKEEGKLRYIGITHYKDSSHEDLEKILKTEKLDFVQFNYSILDRNAEERLLNVAADLGVATLINRPFGEGSLFNKVRGKNLPAWAPALGIDNWSVYFLKYIIAHPAVTCVIPATSKDAHAAENVKAGMAELPDTLMKKKMVDYLNQC